MERLGGTGRNRIVLKISRVTARLGVVSCIRLKLYGMCAVSARWL